MIASFRAPIICAFLLCGSIQASSAEGPELLDRVIEAHGGLDRFRAIRDWRIIAERNLEEGDVAHEIYEEYLLRSEGRERTLLVKRREGSTLVYGHDGVRGFALTNGELREDPGAEGEGYYRAHGEYYLRAIPFKWKDPGVGVEHAGRETLNGREVELLRITAEKNVGNAWRDVWIAAIDPESHLLLEARLTHHRDRETWMGPDASGTTEIVYRYGDYREVSGLKVPFRLEYLSAGRKTGENVIREVDIDAGVPVSLFSPDAHRALQDSR